MYIKIIIENYSFFKHLVQMDSSGKKISKLSMLPISFKLTLN